MGTSQEIQADVVVIGKGLAGLTAMITAHASNQKVVAVAAGPGGSAMMSGAIDWFPAPVAWQSHPWGNYPSLLDSAGLLLSEHPHHPYQKLAGGDPKKLLEQLNQAWQVLSGAGFWPVTETKGFRLMPTPVGTYKPTTACLATQAEVDLATLDHARLGILDLQGLGGWQADLMVKGLSELSKYQKNSPCEMIVKTGPLFLPQTPTGGWNFLTLARYLDEHWEDFLATLKNIPQLARLTHLIFPPVLGITSWMSIFHRCKEALGLALAESLATYPSVVGLRFETAATHYLARKQIPLIRGTVVGCRHRDRRITALDLAQGEHKIVIHGQKFILASGGLAGGGIQRTKRWVEPICDLPLFCEHQPLHHGQIEHLIHAGSTQDQRLFKIGVRTNADLVPLDHFGQACFENLKCAGGLLGGYHPLATPSQGGVAILSGYLAGRSEG